MRTPAAVFSKSSIAADRVDHDHRRSRSARTARAGETRGLTALRWARRLVSLGERRALRDAPDLLEEVFGQREPFHRGPGLELSVKVVREHGGSWIILDMCPP